MIEIACNDGYMLNFFKNKSIPHLGIEPTNTVNIAKSKGINVVKKFFNLNYARNLKKSNYSADCLIGNNVLAHVPNIVDFLKGVKLLLKDNGVAVFEFPHLLTLIKYRFFDTIYHEHFSYLSIIFLEKVLKKTDIKIFDVKKTKIHGGSLRVFISHSTAKHKVKKSVNDVITEELLFKLDKKATYKEFAREVKSNIRNTKRTLLDLSKKNAQIIGYGAAAKATVMINLLNLNNKIIKYLYDKANFKHNKYIPSSNIKINDFNDLKIGDIDYVIIFPWNIKNEIIKQFINEGMIDFKVITLIPELSIETIKR